MIVNNYHFKFISRLVNSFIFNWEGNPCDDETGTSCCLERKPFGRRVLRKLFHEFERYRLKRYVVIKMQNITRSLEFRVGRHVWRLSSPGKLIIKSNNSEFRAEMSYSIIKFGSGGGGSDFGRGAARVSQFRRR